MALTDKHLKCIIFIIWFFFSVTYRGDSKQEGSRRRHASSRQLSIIADGPDPFDLLGLIGVERPKEGQVIILQKCYNVIEFFKNVFI